MPRTARASAGGVCYHVNNRGNDRGEVFHDGDDYDAFVRLLTGTEARLPARSLAFALMPNHFHLVLWPRHDGDLGRWMRWLLTSQVRRNHRRYKGSGHVWQGRFKAFPIQLDEHHYAVMRYVERNPLRAGLTRKPDNWPWTSLAWRRGGVRPDWLADWPLPCPRDWLARVSAPQTDAELAALRHSLERGTPFGDAAWTKQTAVRLGLQASLRSRGRPRTDSIK